MRNYGRKAQLQAAQRAVGGRKVDPIIESIMGFWLELGRKTIPVEPLAREWRKGNQERMAQWAKLNFHERHAVYRRVDELRDPASGNIKKKAIRS